MSWTTEIAVFSGELSEHSCDWARKPYHLAEALKRICRTLSVNILSQSIDEIYPDERDLLSCAHVQECAYVRQIFLEGDGVPLCFARVTVPLITYYHYEDQFKNLGENLLGNALLYAQPGTVRGEFEFTIMTEKNPLYIYLKSKLPKDYFLAETVFARRSLFCMEDKFPLVVTEIFLNQLPAYKEG